MIDKCCTTMQQSNVSSYTRKEQSVHKIKTGYKKLCSKYHLIIGPQWQ